MTTDRALPVVAAAQRVLVIERGRRRAWADVIDVWRFRELVYTLAARDVKVRYAQTALGVVWVLLQPALSALLFFAVFGRLAKMPSDGIPYAVFAVTGIVPWLFVSNSVGNASTSVLTAAPLIGKVYFPRLIVPIAATAAALVDLVVAMPLAMVAALLAGLHVFTPVLLLAPLFCLGLVVAAAAVGTLLCSLTVVFRDFRHVIPFLIQIWLYATPIVYPSSLVPERWRPVFFLNPVAGALEGFRASVCGLPVPWDGVLVSTLSSLFLLAVALRAFAAVERQLVDRL